MSRIPNDGFSNLNFSQLIGTTNSTVLDLVINGALGLKLVSILRELLFLLMVALQFAGQFLCSTIFPKNDTRTNLLFNKQQAFQQAQLNTQFQNFQTQNVPETQFKVPQPQPPQKETRRKGKRMAKKSSFPAVDLSADDDNIEDEEDVVMTTTAPTQTFVRWTRDEEMLLCEVWVEVSENIGYRRYDRNEECFWGRL
ncbi:hypothetical protein Tco_0720406 [Tanacetum coccineum]